MNDCALKDLHETELKLERLLKQLGLAPNSPEQKAWEALPGRTAGRALSTRGCFKLWFCLSPVFGHLDESAHRGPNP